MVITKEILDELTAEAKASPRLRMNRDLRNSPEDKSQRMLTLSTSVTTRHSSSMLGSALAAPSVECSGVWDGDAYTQALGFIRNSHYHTR